MLVDNCCIGCISILFQKKSELTETNSKKRFPFDHQSFKYFFCCDAAIRSFEKNIHSSLFKLRSDSKNETLNEFVFD